MAGVEAGTVDVAVATGARIAAATRGAHTKAGAVAAAEAATPHIITSPATTTAAAIVTRQVVTELMIHIRNIDL